MLHTGYWYRWQSRQGQRLPHQLAAYKPGSCFLLDFAIVQGCFTEAGGATAYHCQLLLSGCTSLPQQLLLACRVCKAEGQRQNLPCLKAFCALQKTLPKMSCDCWLQEAAELKANIRAYEQHLVDERQRVLNQQQRTRHLFNEQVRHLLFDRVLLMWRVASQHAQQQMDPLECSKAKGWQLGCRELIGAEMCTGCNMRVAACGLRCWH